MKQVIELHRSSKLYKVTLDADEQRKFAYAMDDGQPRYMEFDGIATMITNVQEIRRTEEEIIQLVARFYPELIQLIETREPSTDLVALLTLRLGYVNTYMLVIQEVTLLLTANKHLTVSSSTQDDP